MGRLFAEDICDRDNQVQPDFCYVAGVGKGMDPVVRHTGSPDILLSVHNTPITNKVLKLVRATSFTEPREEYWAVGARALPSGVDDGASGSRSLSDTLVSSEVHSPGGARQCLLGRSNVPSYGSCGSFVQGMWFLPNALQKNSA